MKNTITITLALTFVCCCLLLRAQPLETVPSQSDFGQAAEQAEREQLRNLVFQMMDLEIAQAGLEQLYLERTVFQECVWLSQGQCSEMDCHLQEGELQGRMTDAAELMEELHFEMLDLEADLMLLRNEIESLSPYVELAGEGKQQPENSWWGVDVDHSLVLICVAGLAQAEDLGAREMWQELKEMAEDLIKMNGWMNEMRRAVEERKGGTKNT